MTAPPAAAPWRLFLALWPSAAVAAALQQHAALWQWPATARRTAPERQHITLHFLGNVAMERLPALQAGLRLAWPGCELVLDRAQVWPGGIAVLEAGSVPRELSELHARLGEALASLELPVETRQYRPHVTLARKAQEARPPTGFEPVRWHVGPEYVLVRSLPGGRGYLAVNRFGKEAR